MHKQWNNDISGFVSVGLGPKYELSYLNIELRVYDNFNYLNR